MAGLFLVHARDPAFADAAMAGARAQFARHGFGAGTERALDGWRVLHAPYESGGPETFLAQGEDSAAVAGTFTGDGRIDAEALEALLAMDSPDRSRTGAPLVALVH